MPDFFAYFHQISRNFSERSDSVKAARIRHSPGIRCGREELEHVDPARQAAAERNGAQPKQPFAALDALS